MHVIRIPHKNNNTQYKQRTLNMELQQSPLETFIKTFQSGFFFSLIILIKIDHTLIQTEDS